MTKTNSKQEGTMAVIAALLVIFTTMLDPLVSAGLAILLMVVFAVWKFSRK
jgi:hypothetical protein